MSNTKTGSAKKRTARKKAKENTGATRRIGLIDDIRGLCVFCMIFYHGFLLLGDGFGVQFGTDAYEFFKPAQPFFAGTFIVLCGVSCRLSHSNWKRGAELFGIALAINLITILLLPRIHLFGYTFTGTEIWFGILNLLSVCILLFALTQKVVDWLPPAAGAFLMCVLYYVTRFFEEGLVGFPGELETTVPASWMSHFWTFPLGLHDGTFWSADYFPLIPWAFLFFAGAYLGIYVKENTLPEFVYPARVRPLTWLGQHALLVYVLHVPAWWVVLEILDVIGII